MSGGHKKETYYRYVPYHREKSYEAVGWQYSGPLGPPHAAYASLYEWVGEGAPVEPEIEIEVKKKPNDKSSIEPVD